MLEQEHIDVIALDTDPERVRERKPRREGRFGDASRYERSWRQVWRERARSSLPSRIRSLRCVSCIHVRALNPALPVIVRTLDDADMDRLIAAGRRSGPETSSRA